MHELTESHFPALRQALAGRYDLQGPIARGGMGVVYLAREVRLDRPVAVKLLPPELAADGPCRERFLREARTAAGLAHPNIVPIYSVHEVGDFVFFTMAYVAGETLAQRVATRGPLGAEEGARLLAEVGEALAYAHARGIVHRDVKPDNILIETATRRALLADFGIAHVSPHGRPTAPSGPVLGTAAFMSPEQARGEPVDGRSDVYSLGVVAFYALSGRLPFEAPTDGATLILHILEPAPALRAIAPSVPSRLAFVVDRCLAKDPWARFADVGALVRAVADAVEPPRAPLAVRAFLIRGANRAMLGLLLLPVTVLTWLETSDYELRAAVSAACIAALLLPVFTAIVRVRRLLAAGYQHEGLVQALTAERARRREELAFVYGAVPTLFERTMERLARVAALVAGTSVWVHGAPFELVAGAGIVAVLAAIVARARTELRTDPRGERRLRFWRGPLGRWLFRVAGFRLRNVPPIVTILSRFETPA
ncbi:MAG TPA: serine/threonine-protein kinase [Gemmatimonadales bacterium]|jgi:serine/threonine-protein kinase|nr:serine/threonine-protein kinase [Gemmatimonadales bacterium]